MRPPPKSSRHVATAEPVLSTPRETSRSKTAVAVLLWLLVCLLALPSVAHAQIAAFGNPGFESADFNSWTVSVPTGATATLAPTVGTTNGDPGSGSVIHSGTRAFQASVVTPGTSPNFPSLTHSTFTAGAASTYMVSFWLWSGGTQAVNRPNMKLHIRSTLGPSYDVLFQPSSVGWDEFHWTFKAIGATTISFTFEQAATFCLDDVRVFDQNDAGMDVLTQYAWQWGFQGTNSSTSSTIRKTCWTGGDNDIAVQLPDGRTMWFFNDSFIGGLNLNSNLRYLSSDSATSGFSFVRNYVAFQSVDKGTLTPIITTPGTFFLPPQSERDSKNAIYWPNDAILEGDKVQVLFDEPSNGGPGPLVAKRIGTLSPPNYNSPVYTDFAFGNFALNGGDGYIYIYDTDGKGGMSVARAAYGSLTNVAAWQFWLGGTNWGARPTTLVTVPNLHGGTRCFERMGPNNYLAGGNNGNDFQFAQYPWGPWTSIKRYSPIDVTTNFYGQMSNNYYYYFILHKELAQNGVYTVGYCDNGGDKKNAAGFGGEDSVDNSGFFSMDQKSKGYYAPRYIKSNNLLAVSPYTTTALTETFDNPWESVWWQPYGGTWSVGNGVLQQSNATASFLSILKGLLETNLTYTADVTPGSGSGAGGGLLFRASTYRYGTDNYLGYNVLLKPGTGVVLSASTDNGGNRTLAQAPLTVTAGTTYRVRVVAYGMSIQVYVNDLVNPLLSVTDATYTTGGVGVRTDKATGTFDNLTVRALTVPPPTIASFTPASGTVGSSVTLNGTNFTSPVSVAFAGTPATLSGLTTSQLTVTVPAGATTGAITVTTPSGSALTSASYNVGVAPVITSATTAAGQVGQPFTYTVAASNSPTSYTASGVPAGLSFDGATGVLSGTPNAAGTFPISLRASNPYGTGAMTLSLTIQAQTSFASWGNTYFTAAQLQDASVSGPSAAPAGDGIVNLLKYALNLNPNVSGTAALPVPSLVSDGGQSYLALTYTRVAGATDIAYAVQVSGDLQQWQAGSGYTTNVSTVNSGDNKTQTVTVRDLIPTSAGNPRFIRLNVSMP